MNATPNSSVRLVAIIEARMTSSRLPGKVLMDICGKPSLEHLINRLKQVASLDDIVIATTYNLDDDPVHALADQLGVLCYRGGELDVLGRVLGAAKTYKADVIVEITADCPLLDPELSRLCIEAYFNSKADYAALDTKQFPTGIETQVFATNILSEVNTSHRDDPEAREHVSLPIYQDDGRYRLHYLQAPHHLSWPGLRLDLDTEEDLSFIRAIYEKLYFENPYFGLFEVLTLIRESTFPMRHHRNNGI